MEDKIGTSEGDFQLSKNYQKFSDFVKELQDYKPCIPDAVTQYYLNNAGCQTDDPRIIRLLGLATQLFISNCANNAYQIGRMKNAAQISKSKSRDRKHTLTVEDLSQALSDNSEPYTFTIKKPYYYV